MIMVHDRKASYGEASMALPVLAAHNPRRNATRIASAPESISSETFSDTATAAAAIDPVHRPTRIALVGGE